MKIVKVAFTFGLVMASQVSAEPYADWGRMNDGTSIAGMDHNMLIPDASDVPIPLPPGGVLEGLYGEEFVVLSIRTHMTPGDVCSFFESKLLPLGYDHVDFDGFDFGQDCTIYKDGDIESNMGVLVSFEESRLFDINGTTKILIRYVVDDGLINN